MVSTEGMKVLLLEAAAEYSRRCLAVSTTVFDGACGVPAGSENSTKEVQLHVEVLQLVIALSCQL